MSPERAYIVLKNNPNHPHKENLESLIAQRPFWSYRYAQDVLKSRFVQGEEIISESPAYAYYYAFCVIKGRFIIGEEAMIQDESYLLPYEKNIGIKLL
jgi:hypothetical protein